MSPLEANTPSSPSEPAGSECSLSYYKTQYEQLEAELAHFQSSSRELEAELERDVEAAEKRERHLQEKVENLGFEVNEWKVSWLLDSHQHPSPIIYLVDSQLLTIPNHRPSISNLKQKLTRRKTPFRKKSLQCARLTGNFK
jgi:DNA repair exonuclease SbcCD ATPase subunit